MSGYNAAESASPSATSRRRSSTTVQSRAKDFSHRKRSSAVTGRPVTRTTTGAATRAPLGSKNPVSTKEAYTVVP
jgi:hypothetical protein